MCPHLANTIKFVLSSAHPSPQHKQQTDRFIHFCTAHGSVLSPKNCPFAERSGSPSNTCFLGPTGVHNPNGIWTGSAVFVQFTSECRRACRACPSPSKLPLPMGDLYPHLIRGSLSPPDSIPNGISIGSAIFAGLTSVTERPTD